ncbi:MAG: hypothetical protein KDA93_11910 [Planctomycetaceae bacterium]|nr:hypothetical protein [Planctomycetaceae bacterium]
MLKSLLAGGLLVGLPGTLSAQTQRQPRPQPGRATTQGVQQVGTAQISSPEEPVQVNPEELERVLNEWEQKTSKIEKLRGIHQRYEYDHVFNQEKRAVGSFWHEAPDKGRIDFNVDQQPEIPKDGINPAKKGPNGQSFHVIAEAPTMWVCNGAEILQIDIDNKSFNQIEIPVPDRGQNIMDGPLPFLFGMKAEKLKTRYQMSLGQMHGQTDNTGRPIYHLVASPLLQSDARNWKRAEVRLDAKYCLPIAIRLIDPGGTKETVYVFPLRNMKANSPWDAIMPNPFNPRLSGFKLQQVQQAPPQQALPQQRKNVLDANIAPQRQ